MPPDSEHLWALLPDGTWLTHREAVTKYGAKDDYRLVAALTYNEEGKPKTWRPIMRQLRLPGI